MCAGLVFLAAWVLDSISPGLSSSACSQDTGLGNLVLLHHSHLGSGLGSIPAQIKRISEPEPGFGEAAASCRWGWLGTKQASG